jgi:hypothetical protein
MRQHYGVLLDFPLSPAIVLLHTLPMSLLRASTRACPRATQTAGRTARRHASDHAGHDAHAVDTTVYPKEGASPALPRPRPRGP